jgi:2-dehydro-3-deoxygalactonokinase
LIGTEIADVLHRYGVASLRLIGAGPLGRLYEAALKAQDFDVAAVDAEEASRLGLAKAAINIWGAQF